MIQSTIFNKSYWLDTHHAYTFSVLDRQQLVVISSQAHLAAKLQKRS